MKLLSKNSFFTFLLFIIISFLSLIIFEFSSRALLGESAWLPGPHFHKVQSYLKLHPTIGFLWKDNVSYSDDVLLPWNDIDFQLSTDNNGFHNHPKAISLFKQKQQINIVGLGDSFIHNAAYVFHEYFSNNNLFYYNMAMHRQCPPQYNLILKEYVVPLKPDWVIYGVYQNDLFETSDFEKWRESGIDWFTYHSGYWSGPATDVPYVKSFVRRYLKGSYSFYRTVKSKYKEIGIFSRKKKQNEERKITSKQVEKVHSYILEAYKMAETNNIKILFVLIPSKATIITGESNKNYNQLISHLQSSNVPLLVLHKIFSDIPRNEELYYIIDSHWNNRGMREGAKNILEFINGY